MVEDEGQGDVLARFCQRPACLANEGVRAVPQPVFTSVRSNVSSLSRKSQTLRVDFSG